MSEMKLCWICTDTWGAEELPTMHHLYNEMSGTDADTGAAHHPMSITAVMQLFTCHAALTMTHHTHAAIFNTWHAFCAEWLRFVSIETGVRFQCGLCNWMWWIGPFLDNGAGSVAQRPPEGIINPSLTDAVPPCVAAGWTTPSDFSSSSSYAV